MWSKWPQSGGKAQREPHANVVFMSTHVNIFACAVNRYSLCYRVHGSLLPCLMLLLLKEKTGAVYTHRKETNTLKKERSNECQ